MVKRRHSIAQCKVVFVIAAFLASGCTTEPEHAGSAENKVSFAFKEGERLYMHYCAICHGEKGDGAGRYYGFGLEHKPADFTVEEFFEERNSAHLYKAISEGSVSVGRSNLCPPWGRTLHKEELEFLVDYITTLPSESN